MKINESRNKREGKYCGRGGHYTLIGERWVRKLGHRRSLVIYDQLSFKG